MLFQIRENVIREKMGFAKRMLKEEQARQYHQSSDTVCEECFADHGFKSFIADNVEANDCSILAGRAMRILQLQRMMFWSSF